MPATCRYRDCREMAMNDGGACVRCQRIADRIRGQIERGALAVPEGPQPASRPAILPDLFLSIGRAANCDACGQAFRALSWGRRTSVCNGRRFLFHTLCWEIWRTLLADTVDPRGPKGK